jgi:glycosyltransferase involved in cell wall biosynthesis
MAAFFILPIHNKENLLEQVLNGIISSCHDNYHVIAILDGCTDNSKQILQDFIEKNKLSSRFTVSFMDDVHEITCLNHGLTKIRLMNPDPNDLIFTIQDDVILQESNIDKKFNYLFSQEKNLGYVSMRLGCDIVDLNTTIGEKNYIESEYGHWKQLGLNNFYCATQNQLVKTQIAIRSPTCVLWNRYQTVGFYDAALAPCGFDCHDFSIRMMQHKFQNAVYVLKYNSELSWGGMRTDTPSPINARHGEIYEHNRRYLAQKHKLFLKSLS